MYSDNNDSYAEKVSLFYDFNKGNLIENLILVAKIKVCGLRIWLMIRGILKCKIYCILIVVYFAILFISPIHYSKLGRVMGEVIWISKNSFLLLEFLYPSKISQNLTQCIQNIIWKSDPCVQSNKKTTTNSVWLGV